MKGRPFWRMLVVVSVGLAATGGSLFLRESAVFQIQMWSALTALFAWEILTILVLCTLDKWKLKIAFWVGLAAVCITVFVHVVVSSDPYTNLKSFPFAPSFVVFYIPLKVVFHQQLSFGDIATLNEELCNVVLLDLPLYWSAVLMILRGHWLRRIAIGFLILLAAWTVWIIQLLMRFVD
ncbi:MAG: hypothetical protein PHZ00_06675 [Candidatus Peribacteraceae bacterium]|nr:hypothetical protein [Candidatus Peribacteraceae bacterium]